MRTATNFRNLMPAAAALVLTLLLAVLAVGQTTSFTYQGRLTDAGSAATGNYDLQFALWDSASGGAQIGSTLTLSTVAVSNGVFNVSLDFGTSSFNGANRFLEIGARPSGGGSFTVLAPRQQVTATPYAIRSVNATTADTATTATTATNATQLGGVAAGNYIQTNDTRLADPRPPIAGSANYIQNTSNQQANTNFNISGDGAVAGTLSGNFVNAATQFNIRGNRVFSVTDDPFVANSNTFAGASAGGGNNTGGGNSFFGFSAGKANTSGEANSFFGELVGINNTSGGLDSFFGAFSGVSNTSGARNSFFGYESGRLNTTGNHNSFVGENAGADNTTGISNTFIGGSVDISSTTSLFTGYINHTGSYNTLIGAGASVELDGLTNATALGSLATVGQSNSLVLGSIKGNNATADTNVGIGTVAPSKRLEVRTSNVGDGIGLYGTGPAYLLSDALKTEKGALGFAGNAGLYSTDAAAGDIVLRANNRLILQHGTSGAGLILTANGTVAIPSLGAASSSQATLCRNSASEIAFCNSSSLRYKTNVANFSGGLNIINRLRPISFIWKTDGVKDIGFGAEEVEKVNPLFTFRNDKGEIEGVRYDRLGVLFVNAFKEQQAQIQAQQREISLQRQQIKQQQAAARQQLAEIAELNKRLRRIETRLRRR